MKALVGAFNQEKALEGAFSVIVQPVVEPMDRFAALVETHCRRFSRAAHTIPYIELDGKQISDSNTIIARLARRAPHLAAADPRAEAISHAATVMLESHTAQVAATCSWTVWTHIYLLTDWVLVALRIKDGRLCPCSSVHLEEYFHDEVVSR